jgi:hypothetical protein
LTILLKTRFSFWAHRFPFHYLGSFLYGVSEHLNFQIGSNHLRKREFDRAEAAFRKAVASPMDGTAASVWLRRLDEFRAHPERVGEAMKP